MVSKEHILSEIRRTAQENGGTAPGMKRFLKATGIKASDWLGRYWTKWSDAIAEAGLKARAWQTKYDDKEVLRKIAALIISLDHFPTKPELLLQRQKDATFPSMTVIRRLGPMKNLAASIVAFSQSQLEYARAGAISGPVASVPDAHCDEPAGVENESTWGFVYLLKSGKNFKIGKTNSIGRREYELKIQLPERAERVHVMRTDDPSGIEQYWHRRFEARRVNSEWFALTPQDVAAFKRRKFM